MSAERFPNLLIPGAPKAGTSSLCEYLAQHPDIFLPPEKEPRFFITDEIRGLPASDPIREYLVSSSKLSLDEYRESYAGRKERYLVDASVQYLYHHETVIPRIRALLGDPAIIVCLRNPVDRAFSNYMYTASADGTFEQAIAEEDKKKAAGISSFHLYVSQGFYCDSVKAYMDAFSRVKVVFAEDLSRDPASVVAGCFEFLGLPSVSVRTDVVHNQSGRPRNKLVEWLFFRENLLKRTLRPVMRRILGGGRMQKLMLKARSRMRTKRPEDKVGADTRARLIEIYRDDILRLQALIGRDLSGWLGERPA